MYTRSQRMTGTYENTTRIPEINHAHSNDTFEYERRHAFLPHDRPRSNTIIRGFHDQPRGRLFHHCLYEHRRNIFQLKRSSEIDNVKLK